jgi:hypothetical protein
VRQPINPSIDPGSATSSERDPSHDSKTFFPSAVS